MSRAPVSSQKLFVPIIVGALVVMAVGATALAQGILKPPADPAVVGSNLKALFDKDRPKVPTAAQEAALAKDQIAAAPAEVERAKTSFPYELRLPQAVPAGSVIAHALASEDVTADGTQVHSLDVFYNLPGGGRLHVWQTDAKLTEKDPVMDAGTVATEASDGRHWKAAATDFDGIRSFSTRFDDGVTMSVDFPVKQVDTKVLLGSVRPAK